MTRARRHPLLLASALATAVVLALSASAGAQTFSQFGAGTLDRPAGVDVDQLGNVYVADSGNAVIRKYSNTGTLLATFGPAIPPNGFGLQTPTGIAVDHPENAADEPYIYVADSASGHVQALSPSGEFVIDYGPFREPVGVDVDAAGHVYVADAGGQNELVAKFTPGALLLNVYGKSGGGSGSAPGQFDDPRDVSIDTDGDMLVADAGNNRLQKLSPAGGSIWQAGSLPGVSGVDHDIDLVGMNLVDRLWVTIAGGDQFAELDDDGNVLTTLGGSGTGSGQFDSPYGIAADCADNVFVADTGNDRIQRYGTASTPPCSAPANTTSPSLAGTAAPGSGLALDPGAWSGSPTPRISYRWQRCSSGLGASCGDISGERSLTYVVREADRGYRLRAVVVAANNQGIVSEPTDMTTPVPLDPVRPLPPDPPNPSPVPPGPPPLPPVQDSKAKRSGLATFRAFCPTTGKVDCRVKADVVGPGSSPSAKSRAERPGMLTLARVDGRVRFGQTRVFELKLTRRARALIRGGYDERAVLRVFIDGKRRLTGRLRVNDRTAGEFAR